MTEVEWQRRAARGAEAGDFATFVVVEDAGLIAVVDGVVTDERTVDVAAMWVQPDRRRTGAGRALLDALREWARTRGAARLALWVATANAPAVALYARAGYSTIATSIVVGASPSLRQVRMARYVVEARPDGRRAISTERRNG